MSFTSDMGKTIEYAILSTHVFNNRLRGERLVVLFLLRSVDPKRAARLARLARLAALLKCAANSG